MFEEVTVRAGQSCEVHRSIRPFAGGRQGKREQFLARTAWACMTHPRPDRYRSECDRWCDLPR